MISTKFGSQVKIISKKDSSTAGNFEITVDGTLVHSKKNNGHGFLHDNAKQQEAVFAAIS